MNDDNCWSIAKYVSIMNALDMVLTLIAVLGFGIAEANILIAWMFVSPIGVFAFIIFKLSLSYAFWMFTDEQIKRHDVLLHLIYCLYAIVFAYHIFGIAMVWVGG